jgi:hypothetical protein
MRTFLQFVWSLSSRIGSSTCLIYLYMKMVGGFDSETSEIMPISPNTKQQNEDLPNGIHISEFHSSFLSHFVFLRSVRRLLVAACCS